MTDKEKKATLLKLQKMKQFPRRCEQVRYEAFMNINAVSIEHEPISGNAVTGAKSIENDLDKAGVF